MKILKEQDDEEWAKMTEEYNSSEEEDDEARADASDQQLASLTVVEDPMNCRNYEESEGGVRCPIDWDIVPQHEPLVRNHVGWCYRKSNVQNWVRNGGTRDPMTNLPLDPASRVLLGGAPPLGTRMKGGCHGDLLMDEKEVGVDAHLLRTMESNLHGSQ